MKSTTPSSRTIVRASEKNEQKMSLKNCFILSNMFIIFRKYPFYNKMPC